MSFETEPLLTQKVDHETKKKKKEREIENSFSEIIKDFSHLNE